ncbi:TerC/Alx family metal homeostasis membrane protein [Schaalia odontolytica]|uniref:TerC/Alx family metal homeostasis membrane protein n=2 Tax=Schaalia odontolytica TaxID=1660 RepID=A0A857A793_9ACTO|nr:TerC/Alx family metal homeostasis membrane protein [Schaalia odontolytica]EFF79004.1 integral membrane protein, TerC family [Schaalia odontolytica F0309]QGS10979.1 TerC/Alx family metal homeostasis membrane protein [Schaalia odontolytica]
MVVHPWAWGILALVAIGLVALDFLGHARNPHPPTAAEAARWTLFYVGLAAVFGVGIWLTNGWLYAQEFYAGWAMEWSLSVDNLFVFILILKAFRVPRENQQKALLFGIVIALLLRLVFILLGAALVARFSWVFFIFGVWLLWTAFSQIKETATGGGDEEEYEENAFIRLVRRVLPITDGFIGDRMLYRHGGRTYLTPLFVVVLALGSADLMFAFDSIPAIFGITSQAFLVFACNVFALMGLRQLFFLVDALLGKLVYLGYGLGVILSFIGIKLILEALHANTLPFINGGRGVEWAPEISVSVSLGVIVVTLVITVIASLVRSAMDEEGADER